MEDRLGELIVEAPCLSKMDTLVGEITNLIDRGDTAKAYMNSSNHYND